MANFGRCFALVFPQFTLQQRMTIGEVHKKGWKISTSVLSLKFMVERSAENEKRKLSHKCFRRKVGILSRERVRMVSSSVKN